MLVDDLGHRTLDELGDALLDGCAFQNLTAVTVDGFALAVEDVVVLEYVLADLGVTAFHLRLGGTNRA